MRATVAGRVEPMLENAASVLAAAREREREARMATARESARVAELEAELTAYRALLPDGKWTSPGASGQTEGERQMSTPKRTREVHPSGEYKGKLAMLRRYVVFLFGSKGWVLEVALLATSSPVALNKALYRAPRPRFRAFLKKEMETISKAQVLEPKELMAAWLARSCTGWYGKSRRFSNSLQRHYDFSERK